MQKVNKRMHNERKNYRAADSNIISSDKLINFWKEFFTDLPSIVMNLVVPQYIIKIVNCRGPKSNSEGADDLDIVCTSKSLGSAKIKPLIFFYKRFRWGVVVVVHVVLIAVEEEK